MNASSPFFCTGYSSFEEMYRSEHSWIHGIVCRMVRSKAAADELTQDVFLRIFRNIAAYVPPSNKAPREGFRSWIGTIAKNRTINYLRRRKIEQDYTKRRARESDDHYFPSSNSEDLLIEKEELERLVRAVNSLPDQGVKETSRLRFLEDQSYKEISDQLRIPKGTVMSRLYRARIQISQRYEENDPSTASST